MNENDPLFAHVITCIFSLLKKNISLLLSTNAKDAEIYKGVKNLILGIIKYKYLNIKEPGKLIRKTISDSLTVIIISGIFYHWTTCIEDLIKECYSSGNLEYIYIVLRALGSIDLLIHYNSEILKDEAYEDSVKISQKGKQQIKDKLIDNRKFVIDFLLNIYKHIGNISNINFRKIIVSQLFDTTKCWINFGLNLLKNSDISQMIYTIMEYCILENPEYFSNMIIDTINNSKNCKTYKYITINENSSPEILSQKLYNSIDKEEKEGMESLLRFILPKLDDLKIKYTNNNLNEYESKLFKEYAKILSSVIESYIYLFFDFKNDLSEKILSWLNYFLKHKKRSISLLFFEGLNEMREFINHYYKFAGLNDKQKINFVNYFMDIVYGVMENCSYQRLDQKDLSLLEQEILCRSASLNPESPQTLLSLNDYKNEYLENDVYDIDVKQYRENAESVFINIFFILIDNFQDWGTSQFLNKLLSSLELEKINEQSYLNNPLSAIKIDVIFYVISSILEVFEAKQAPNAIKNIHKLIEIILDSKIVVQNIRIFIDFIILINKFSEKLVLNQDNFKKVLKFLLSATKSFNNQDIVSSCYIIILNICNEINNEIKIDNSFLMEIFNIYQKVYNKYIYPNIKPLEDIVEIILTLSGISRKIIKINKIRTEENINYDRNLEYVIQQISSPIHNEIKTLIEKVDYNKQDQKTKNILRFEIVKGYLLQGKILSSLKKYSIELRNNFLKDHLNKTLNLTKKIFELFQDDEDVINPLLKFYTENASAIGGNCQETFDLFNKIMLDYYLSSEKHFKALNTLRLLYLSYLISDDSTNELYFRKNKNILDQYSLIMNTFINNISKEKDINPNITDKIEDISDFHHYIFHKLSFNSPLITQNNNDLMKYYNFIEKVIDFFINCVNLFMNLNNSSPVGERILSSIIKSFDAFFVNISISREFLTKQNNNNSCFVIDIILSLWNLIKCKQFNSSSRNQLILCYFNAISYNINLFNNAFEKCLIKSNKFSQVYIKSIIEYIVCFQNDYESIKNMLYLIFDDTQENAEIDIRSYSNLFSLVVRKKGLKKVNK